MQNMKEQYGGMGFYAFSSYVWVGCLLPPNITEGVNDCVTVCTFDWCPIQCVFPPYTQIHPLYLHLIQQS